MNAYGEAMKHLMAGAPLDAALAESVMDEVMGGDLGDARIAALLTALSAKGESAAELTGFARSMRRHAVAVNGDQPLVDTCGTGGSGLATTNTSTLVAFVLAAAGVKVAKHGNRASSGRCGSMDLLERMGVVIDLGPEQATELLNGQGLCFLFAPRFHPAMKAVGGVRRSLGFRTVFNFLGPLCNPAGTKRQLLGVSDPSRAPLMLDALAALGSDRVLVAWGEEGLDELSLSAPTRLWELNNGTIEQRRIEPEQLGLSPVPFEQLQGGEPEENARLFNALLDFQEGGASPREQHLCLNAGAGLMVAGVADSLHAGMKQARELLASGAVRARFDAYRSASQELGAAG